MKGINPLEQHVEKIVVGVVTLVLLVVLAAQFLLSPNNVTVNGQSVPPGDAFETVKVQADALRGKMAARDLPRPEVPEVVLQSELESRLAGAAGLRETYSYAGPTMTFDPATRSVDSQGSRIAMPDLPPPQAVTVAQVSNTLDPMVVANTPGLANALRSTQQPIDVTAVTVEGEIDVEALVAALGQDPDGPGGELKPMSPGWWREGLEILGVWAERQARLPDGSWGQTERVALLPGRVTPLQTEITNRAQMADAIRAASASASAVRRPAYYRHIAGEPWLPPKDVLARQAKGSSQEIDRLLRDRAGRLEERELKTKALEQAQDGARDPGPRPGGRGTPGTGRGDDPADTPTSNTVADRIQRDITRIDEQLAEINQKLIDLGYVEAGAAQPTYTEIADLPRLTENKKVRVWAHDIQAQPGVTYRYRLVVGVNNPIFGRAAVLSEDQQPLAQQVLIETRPSAWTQPLEVDRQKYYFLSSATPEEEGNLGSRKATVDVYEFYYGYWRKGTATLDPGDVVRATASLPKLYVFDIHPQHQGEESSGQPSGANPGNIDPRHVVAPPVIEGEEPVIPEGARPLPEDRNIVLPAQLLDVARVGSPAARIVRAIFADPAVAGLVSRIPARDRESQLLNRLAASARNGLNQGVASSSAEPARMPDPREDPGRTPSSFDPGRGVPTGG